MGAVALRACPEPIRLTLRMNFVEGMTERGKNTYNYVQKGTGTQERRGARQATYLPVEWQLKSKKTVSINGWVDSPICPRWLFVYRTDPGSRRLSEGLGLRFPPPRFTARQTAIQRRTTQVPANRSCNPRLG